MLVKGIFDLPYNIPNIIDIIEKNTQVLTFFSD